MIRYMTRLQHHILALQLDFSAQLSEILSIPTSKSISLEIYVLGFTAIFCHFWFFITQDRLQRRISLEIILLRLSYLDRIVSWDRSSRTLEQAK